MSAAPSDAAPRWLRRDVACEPTVRGWHAWSHLLAPHTAALHLARAQLPILDAFAQAPAVHAAALRNPAMRGGPFLDLDPARAGEAAAFAQRLRAESGEQLAFAEAVGELERLLGEADGHSLEPLYPRVPAPLKGFVELGYDAASRPGYRFLERLLYASALHERGAQALVLRRLEGDARPFVLSTPRLADDGCLELRRPFDHTGVARLLRAREEAAPAGELAEALELGPDGARALAPYLTDAPPPRAAPFDGDGLRVRYCGHACVLLEHRGQGLLSDPLLAYCAGAEPARYALEDLPARIDWVVITHGHQDHVVLESLLALRARIGTVVVPRSSGGQPEDPSLKLALESAGFPRVVELDELERLACGPFELTGLPFLGEHGDLRVRAKLAYLVRTAGRSVVLAADSANLEPELYRRLKHLVGPLDLLFLGMECDGAPVSWLYGALLARPLKRGMDQSRRLCGSDHARASALVEALDPRAVVVYAMGQEPWCGFITSIAYTPQSAPIVQSDRLLATCRAQGRDAERPFGRWERVLAPA